MWAVFIRSVFIQLRFRVAGFSIYSDNVRFSAENIKQTSTEDIKQTSHMTLSHDRLWQVAAI